MLAPVAKCFIIGVMGESHYPKNFKQCKRYNDPGHAHALNFCCYKGQPFLSKERTCTWLARAIQHARVRHAFDLWTYVFMPEHVHLLICPHYENYSVSKILESIKKSVATRAVNYIKAKHPEFLARMLDEQPNGQFSYRFWERGGGYDRNLYSDGALLAEIDYIHANPVRRKLCENISDWKWSSAADHEQIREGPLKIDFHSLPAELQIGSVRKGRSTS